MPRRRSTFATVRAIGLRLPDVEEGTTWGVPALKLRGKILACMAAHKSAEPNSLVVRIDFEQRDALIEDAPGTYYVKPHYVGYPCVLVRLDRVDRDALRDLLQSAWRVVSASSPKRKPRPAGPTRRPR